MATKATPTPVTISRQNKIKTTLKKGLRNFAGKTYRKSYQKRAKRLIKKVTPLATIANSKKGTTFPLEPIFKVIAQKDRVIYDSDDDDSTAPSSSSFATTTTAAASSSSSPSDGASGPDLKKRKISHPA